MSSFIVHKRGKVDVYLQLGEPAEDIQLKSHQSDTLSPAAMVGVDIL